MIHNTFKHGPEGWCSYDYHASMVADGTNVFILATQSATDGPEGTGCVWTDHRRWSADTPESPLSILPLLHYRSWVDAEPIDLRDTQMSAWLRGDNLQLDGASCYFWVHASGTRWHLTDQPLSIADGTWTKQQVLLEPTPERWHCSWSVDPDQPTLLAKVLSSVHSYGFSFVGFSRQVTGRLSLAGFKLHQP